MWIVYLVFGAILVLVAIISFKMAIRRDKINNQNFDHDATLQKEKPKQPIRSFREVQGEILRKQKIDTALFFLRIIVLFLGIILVVASIVYGILS